jgi:rubrerythrin
VSSIKGSQTEKNLLAAFAGESQARNRYFFFAERAREEGYEQIANIFMETSENEREHAKRFFSFLEGGDLEIQAGYPAGMVAATGDNLKAAAEGENLEHTTLYPGFGEIALQEGFQQIGNLFKRVAEVEVYHEKRYLKLMENLNSGQVFKRSNPVLWKCLNCGRIHEGTEAPAKCPTCLKPQAWFMLYDEAY